MASLRNPTKPVVSAVSAPREESTEPQGTSRPKACDVAGIFLEDVLVILGNIGEPSQSASQPCFLLEVVARPKPTLNFVGKTVALVDMQKQRTRNVLRRKQRIISVAGYFKP